MYQLHAYQLILCCLPQPALARGRAALLGPSHFMEMPLSCPCAWTILVGKSLDVIGVKRRLSLQGQEYGYPPFPRQIDHFSLGKIWLRLAKRSLLEARRLGGTAAAPRDLWIWGWACCITGCCFGVLGQCDQAPLWDVCREGLWKANLLRLGYHSLYRKKKMLMVFWRIWGSFSFLCPLCMRAGKAELMWRKSRLYYYYFLQCFHHSRSQAKRMCLSLP